MATVAKALRHTAFGLTVFMAILGSLFIIGETLADPGGTTGVMLSAAWVLPMAVLAAAAVARPKPAGTVSAVVAFAVAAFVALDEVLDIVPRDEVGPVGAIAVFAVGVALGFLGLRRPALAGGLLLLVGAANIAGVFGRMLEAEGGVRSALGGSSGAVAIPVVVLGVLYLLAAWIGSAGRVADGPRPAAESRPALTRR